MSRRVDSPYVLEVWFRELRTEGFSEVRAGIPSWA